MWLLLLQGDADVEQALLVDLCGHKLAGINVEVEAVDRQVSGNNDPLAGAQHLKLATDLLGYPVEFKVARKRHGARGAVLRDVGQGNWLGHGEGGRWVIVGVQDVIADVNVAFFHIGAELGQVNGNLTGGQRVVVDGCAADDEAADPGGFLRLSRQHFMEGEANRGGVWTTGVDHGPFAIQIRGGSHCPIAVQAPCLHTGASDGFVNHRSGGSERQGDNRDYHQDEEGLLVLVLHGKSFLPVSDVVA